MAEATALWELLRHAARLGLFDMSWNMLCPGCGGVLETLAFDEVEDAVVEGADALGPIRPKPCARRRSIARSTDTWRGSDASSREQPTRSPSPPSAVSTRRRRVGSGTGAPV